MGEYKFTHLLYVVSLFLIAPIQSHCAGFDFQSEKFNFYRQRLKAATKLSIEKERIKKLNEFKETLNGAPAKTALDYLKNPQMISSEIYSAINNNRSSNCWESYPKEKLFSYISEHCEASASENICRDSLRLSQSLNKSIINTNRKGADAAIETRNKLMCSLNKSLDLQRKCKVSLDQRIGSQTCLTVYDVVLSDDEIALIANSCTLESIDEFMISFGNEIGNSFAAPGETFDRARQNYALSRKSTIELAQKYGVLTNYITQDLKTRVPASAECP